MTCACRLGTLYVLRQTAKQKNSPGKRLPPPGRLVLTKPARAAGGGSEKTVEPPACLLYARRIKTKKNQLSLFSIFFSSYFRDEQ